MIAKIVEPCPKLRLDHSKAHTPQHRRQKIRLLNDTLRRTGKGGRVMYTGGIVGQGLDFAAEVGCVRNLVCGAGLTIMLQRTCLQR